MYGWAAPRNKVRQGLAPAHAVSMALTLLLVGCGGESPQPTVGTAPAGNQPAAPLAEEIDPVRRAREALRERRLVSPDGDNAVHWYLVALEHNPADPIARAALLELSPEVALVVESSIGAGELDRAERELALLARMGAGELRLAALRSRLTQARYQRERAVAEQGESARTEAAAPRAPTVSATKARVADEAPQPASPGVTSAASPPPPPAAAPVAALSPASEAPSGAPLASAPNPTPRAPSAAEIQVEEARQIVDVLPAYPAQARQRKVEGWVELELALAASGEVIGIEVVRSEPPRIFDREAIRAAQRWRFEPRRENGVPVATRVRKTVTFRLSG
jgi:protein TonB